jgi:hypothetical protein
MDTRCPQNGLGNLLEKYPMHCESQSAISIMSLNICRLQGGKKGTVLTPTPLEWDGSYAWR